MKKYDTFEVESLDIAKNFHKLGKYTDSISVCMEVIQHNANNSEAHNLLGVNMLKMKSYKEAIDYFKKASSISPDNTHYIINLTKSLWLIGDKQQAIDTLSQFLNQANQTLAFFELAQYLSKNNEHDKAIDIYKALSIIKPNNMQVLFTLADEYIKNNDIKSSLTFLEKAYNLGHQEAGIKLLNQYIKLNMTQDAIDFAKKYIFTKNADFYFLYANALNLNGNFSEAKSCYKIAIEMNNKPRYLFGYATFLLKNREYADGFRYYEKRKDIQGFSENVKKLFSTPDDVKDKVALVFYEQNISDTIIFSRFLPKLQAIAKKVYFYPQKELANIFDIDCVTSLNIDYDVAVPLPSLPYILNVSKDSDLDLRAPFLLHKTESFKKPINIAFAFGDLGKMKHDRIKLERILDITAGIDDVNLISVKLGGIDSFYSENFKIIDKGKECKHYSDVLKILLDIDLFVGNDTEYMHLAAGFGTPCILFKDTQRWIWESGKKTNWYKNFIILGPDKDLRWDNAIKVAFRLIKKYALKN